MMRVILTKEQREELEGASRQARRVRQWGRYQAILRLDDGESVPTIARALDVGKSTVRKWQQQWQQRGMAGIRERFLPGAPRQVPPPAETQIRTWLAGSPLDDGFTATNWTITLLGTALARTGTLVSPSTLRRTLKRLGYRWKRPKYVIDRPDPDHAEKQEAVVTQATAMLARGGELWDGDETTTREFPPLRAAWSLVGVQAVVPLTGNNPRRVLFGGLNLLTGELVTVTRERSRGEDVVAWVEALGKLRPEVPKLLIWDNAPAHKTRAVREALAAANIEVASLPFRSPELNPIEDLWRHLKAHVVANRVYGDRRQTGRRGGRLAPWPQQRGTPQESPSLVC